MRRSEFIARQGRKPFGIIGAVVGRIMARETASDNKQAIKMLDIHPQDHVVDIGTGHGSSLCEIADLASTGLVVGVDFSDVMLAIASKRNEALIRAGRIHLEKAPSDKLPFPDASFDKAVAVHTLYFWNPAEPHLREIARVLRPGGQFLLAFRPAEDTLVTAKFPASVYTFRTTDVVESILASAGFSIASVRHDDVPGRSIVWLLATRN